MMKKLTLSALTALALSTGGAMASEGGHVHDVDFSFEGPFGKFDQMQLQRGLQVYTEVCSACHGMKFVPIRTLGDKGGPELPEDQVRAYAAQFPVNDEASNMQLFDYNEGAARPLTANDHFPANHSMNAPDLSLMAKARAGFHGPYGTGINQFLKGIGGPEHIVSILTGSTGEERSKRAPPITRTPRSRPVGSPWLRRCTGKTSNTLTVTPMSCTMRPKTWLPS